MHKINTDKKLLLFSTMFVLMGMFKLIHSSNWFALAGFSIIYVLIISIQVLDIKYKAKN